MLLSRNQLHALITEHVAGVGQHVLNRQLQGAGVEGHLFHLFQVVLISDFPLLPVGIEQGGDGAFFSVPVLAVIGEPAAVGSFQLLLGLF